MTPAQITALAEKHALDFCDKYPDWLLDASKPKPDRTQHFLRFLAAALDEMGVERALDGAIDFGDFTANPNASERLRTTLTTIRAVKDAGKDL